MGIVLHWSTGCGVFLFFFFVVLPLFGLLPWIVYALEQDITWVLVLCSTCHGPWSWHDRNAKSHEQVLIRVKLDWQGYKLLGFKKELSEFPLQSDSYVPLWWVFLCCLPKATELLLSGNTVLHWKIYQHLTCPLLLPLHFWVLQVDDTKLSWWEHCVRAWAATGDVRQVCNVPLLETFVEEDARSWDWVVLPAGSEEKLFSQHPVMLPCR